MLPRNAIALFFGTFFGLTISLYGNEDLSRIAAVIPPNANALTIVDYAALAESEWAKNNNLAVGDLIGAPESASQVVVATNLDFEHFSSESQVVFLQADKRLTFDHLCQNGGDKLDRIGDTDVFWLGDRVSVAKVDDRCFALTQLRDRQQVGRWVRGILSQPNNDRASPFLRYAIKQVGKEKSLAVIAFDFQDAISPAFVRNALVDQSVEDDLRKQELAKLLAGIEGVVITINASDELTAKVQIRFQGDAKMLEQGGLSLFATVIDNMGAQLREMKSWKTDVDENVVTLHGSLTREGFDDLLSLAVYDAQIPIELRRLASLATVSRKRMSNSIAGESSAIGNSNSEGASTTTSNPDLSIKAMRSEATQEYMGRVRRLLNSLNRKTDESFAQSRFWLDRYAFKIQYQNRENVDEELLKFADQTTKNLRVMAEEIENAMLAAAEEYESGFIATPTWRTVNYGGIRIRRRAYFYGGNQYGNDRPAVDRLQAKDDLNDAGTKVKAAGIGIVRNYNEVGEKMAKKYGFDFERWTPGGIQ